MPGGPLRVPRWGWGPAPVCHHMAQLLRQQQAVVHGWQQVPGEARPHSSQQLLALPPLLAQPPHRVLRYVVVAQQVLRRLQLRRLPLQILHHGQHSWVPCPTQAQQRAQLPQELVQGQGHASREQQPLLLLLHHPHRPMPAAVGVGPGPHKQQLERGVPWCCLHRCGLHRLLPCQNWLHPQQPIRRAAAAAAQDRQQLRCCLPRSGAQLQLTC